MEASAESVRDLQRRLDRWFIFLCVVVLLQFFVAEEYSNSFLERGAFLEVGLLMLYHLVGKIKQPGWSLWALVEVVAILGMIMFAVYPDWRHAFLPSIF